MAKINEQRIKYFGWNEKADVLYFNSDDMAFYEEGNALQHGRSLKAAGKGTDAVDVITRAEATAWNPAQTEADEQKDPEMMDHEVTQEDLDNNPDLVAAGVTVGEIIQIPVVCKEENELLGALDSLDKVVAAGDVSAIKGVIEVLQSKAEAAKGVKLSDDGLLAEVQDAIDAANKAVEDGTVTDDEKAGAKKKTAEAKKAANKAETKKAAAKKK
jgi:hypothetical protein